MFKLDNALLEELGLRSLPPQEKNMMLRHIYETLELRVGMKLAARMSKEQLEEFEQLMPRPEDSRESITSKQAQAMQWLSSNFPDYKQVVADELETLKNEIRQAAPQIIASSQDAQSSEQQNQFPTS